MKLKPYPEYKDSGIQWIGKIPEGWEVHKLKFLLSSLDSGTRETGGGSQLDAGIFSLGGEPQPKLHNLLNPVVDEFRKKSKKEQVEFKKTLKRYQSIYSFLSQLIPFSDVNLEKMYLFNKFLSKKLPTINNPLPFNVLEDVDIDSYKVVHKGLKEIKLQSEGELIPMSDGVGNYAPDINTKLSKILKDLNDAFGTDFTDDDKVFLNRVKDNLLQNKELVNKMEYNSKENVKAVFDKYFNQEMTKLLNSNMKFYKRLVDNEKLKTQLKSALFDLVYFEFNRKNKQKSPNERQLNKKINSSA